MQLKIKKHWKLLGFVFMLLFTFSCSDDDDKITGDVGEEQEETSKTFIYNHFKENYLWLDELPEVDPNSYSTNEELVEALRYKELDHWSYVTDLDKHRALMEDAETKGFGVGLAYFQDTKQMFARFTYAKAPMGLAGVDRGWEFYKINGTLVTDMANPWETLDTDEQVDFTFITISNDTIECSMTRTNYEINTVLHESVQEAGNRRVGYLVYESFIGDESEEELNDAFNFFQSEGIDDIVIDLRYNGGGRLDIAWRLTELLGGADVVLKVLTTIEYNEKRKDEKTSLIGRLETHNAVNFPRVYFITTDGSASASEMVINSLFPYKEVILIGETTHGKPVGMEVEESEEYNIALAPITFKLVNAEGNGDYFDGIPVDYEALDDIFHAWGDPEEASLKTALQVISGEGGELALKSAFVRPVPVPLKRGLQEITGAY